MKDETKQAWVVEVNSDLTEGRGRQIVKAICELEATALRLARGADVQGSNGRVRAVDLVRVACKPCGFEWWGPITLVPATAEDQASQERLSAMHSVKAKALAAGLTEDEIGLLQRA